MPEPLAHREVDHGGIKEVAANNVRHSQYHETREKNPLTECAFQIMQNFPMRNYTGPQRKPEMSRVVALLHSSIAEALPNLNHIFSSCL